MTNLNEHMPSDTRLSRFLEIAANVLEYFEPYLGRIEIMGSAKRVERVYFEIKQSSITQWKKPQIIDSKRAFLYNVVIEGGDKEKLEMFVNFCEDAIFEMQHASSISMEEDEESSQPKSAARYPLMVDNDEGVGIKELLKRFLWHILLTFLRILSLCTPSNLAKQAGSLKEKTPVELVIGIFRFAFGSLFFSGYCVFAVVRYVSRIILHLMTGESLAGEPKPSEEHLQLSSPRSKPPMLALPTLEITSVDKDRGSNVRDNDVGMLNADNKQDLRHTSLNSLMNEEKTDAHKTESFSGPSNSIDSLTLGTISPDTSTTANLIYSGESPSNVTSDLESSESTPLLKGHFKLDIGMVSKRFLCFLARNYYYFKKCALIIVFIINFLLLFYRVGVKNNSLGVVSANPVDISAEIEAIGIGSGEILEQLAQSAESQEFGLEEETADNGSDEESQEYVYIYNWWMIITPLLQTLSVTHLILAVCMLIGYHHLKLPLVIFKKEKEISRAMEFEGLYITDQTPEGYFAKWDNIVISSPSFPNRYWDKFVKKRVREKYVEQFDYESISQILGMQQGAFNDDSGVSDSSNQTGFRLVRWFKNWDYRYFIWRCGITFTDGQFLYNLLYITFSFCGNYFSYFFFAAHLLDIAFVVKSLRTILESVTHNGRQLVLTVVLLAIVVYIYTVFSFIFFRNFYVQSDEDEDAEGNDTEASGEVDKSDKGDDQTEYLQNRKCHSMYTCFIFNLYQGKLRYKSDSRIFLQ